MGKLTKDFVVKVFQDYKKDILNKLENKNNETAACLIEKAAEWANLFNFEFYDKDLEDGIREIVNCIVPKEPFEPISGRMVFVCSQMHDNGELVRHYVRAIADNNIPTRMIVLDKQIAFGYSKTLNEIKQAENIDLQLVPPNLGYIETAQIIATLIEEFKPERILQHFVPSEVKCLVGVSLIPKISRYNINYTDHTFWLGASFIDYNIEFRPYGYIFSHEKRNIDLDKLFILPFYPIIDESASFQGFPFNRDGKIVLFSGGNPYKVLGDNDKYFKMLDRILLENKNCIALIAIFTSFMKKKIEQMQCRDRVFLVPFRKDICELMKHIDIFYNTYPVGGGLTCLLAAKYGKPVLAYAKDGCLLSDFDGMFFSQNNNNKYSFNDIDALCMYAHHLCENNEYRFREGQKLHESCTTRENFAKRFGDIINKGKTIDMQNVKLDYDGIFDLCVNGEKEAKTFVNHLFEKDGISVFYKYPKFYLEFTRLLLCKTYTTIRMILSYIYKTLTCKKKKN